jgi:hypothetical protein
MIEEEVIVKLVIATVRYEFTTKRQCLCVSAAIQTIKKESISASPLNGDNKHEVFVVLE